MLPDLRPDQASAALARDGEESSSTRRTGARRCMGDKGQFLKGRSVVIDCTFCVGHPRLVLLAIASHTPSTA